MSEKENPQNAADQEAEKKPEEEVKKESDPTEALQKQVDELQKQNAELQKKVDVLKNEYARAYADTANTRKRLENEFAQLSKYQAKEFALQIIPVMDDCERALAHETSDEVYQKGVQMIYSKLQAALVKEGITEIDCKGKPFDANFHQALMSEHVEGVEPGTVLEVLQKGYMIKDRLLRAAMVKVSE